MDTGNGLIGTGVPGGLMAIRRVAWLDFAKSVAIVLVVLYHVGGAGIGHLFPNPEGVASEFWAGVNQSLLPMRMPLFFAAAGLLAHHSVRRPWGRIWRTRIAVPLWTYLLWSVGLACLSGFAYHHENPGAYAVYLLRWIPFAGSAYWFLAVVAVLHVAAKLLHRWPRPVLAATLVVALASPYVEASIPEAWPNLLTYAAVKASRYAFWYFLGCYGAQSSEKIARMNPWSTVIGGGVSFAILTYVAWSGQFSAPLSLPLSATGLVAAIGLSTWAVRSARVRTISKYIADRTLPIYLLHPVLINLMVLLSVGLGGPLKPNDPWATALTPVLVIACIVASVFTYDRILPTRFAWIYRLPQRR